ncbi:hypothetical protein, partial [Rubrivirga sp.]|uniref:hypothetical protein n=1 Tax=Rubrivirga sp. TaxID=1885344 RepID=UPI003C72006C
MLRFIALAAFLAVVGCDATQPDAPQPEVPPVLESPRTQCIGEVSEATDLFPVSAGDEWTF